MLSLTRWTTRHRWQVVVGWIAIAAMTTVLAGAVGRHFATDFGLPGTESQRASDLLAHQFKGQGGDLDTIVFHVTQGTVYSPQVHATVDGLLSRIRTFPHVLAVTGPYSRGGKAQVSSNG
jgi:putative drug exporter of the RND superfamily